MKTSTTSVAIALGWAVLVSVAGRGEWVASWLAMGTLSLAPLALAILVALSPRRQGQVSAAEAEALAWSQAEPPAPPKIKGHRVETPSRAWHARPSSA